MQLFEAHTSLLSGSGTVLREVVLVMTMCDAFRSLAFGGSGMLEIWEEVRWLMDSTLASEAASGAVIFDEDWVTDE